MRNVKKNCLTWLFSADIHLLALTCWFCHFFHAFYHEFGSNCWHMPAGHNAICVLCGKHVSWLLTYLYDQFTFNELHPSWWEWDLSIHYPPLSLLKTASLLHFPKMKYTFINVQWKLITNCSDFADLDCCHLPDIEHHAVTTTWRACGFFYLKRVHVLSRYNKKINIPATIGGIVVLCIAVNCDSDTYKKEISYPF